MKRKELNGGNEEWSKDNCTKEGSKEAYWRKGRKVVTPKGRKGRMGEKRMRRGGGGDCSAKSQKGSVRNVEGNRSKGKGDCSGENMD